MYRGITASAIRRARGARGRFNYSTSTSFDIGLSNGPTDLPRLTAADIATYSEPPRGVKVLVRDYIHDALYNPSYGYFNKRAMIFSTPSPFNFKEMRSAAAFDNAVSEVYMEITKNQGDLSSPVGTQLWHTPVELFQPWYGQAIARCLVSEYLLRSFPYEDFVIYEMGGGNGTLGINILDYLRDEYPEVYERTSYKIIEISPNLARIQKRRLKAHAGVFDVINQSIFDWQETIRSPCFFMALEVIDNFAHDVIRYDMSTSKMYQGLVATTKNGEYEEVYESVQDPLIRRYLDYRDASGHVPAAFANRITSHPALRHILSRLPFAPNLTKAEFIPTRLISFLEILRDKFPRHRLLLSDFHSLPNGVNAMYNAPVVQTRYNGTMIPCSTYMVRPGYFDIFFPTNFDLLRDLYSVVVLQRAHLRSSATPRIETNFFSSRREHVPFDLGGPIERTRIYSHREFLLKYAELEGTELRSGENPMLDYYGNVKVMF